MPLSAIPEDFNAPLITACEDTSMYGGVLGTVCKYTDEDGPFKRLQVRVDCKTPKGVFPITFICDTCAPSGLYLCRFDLKRFMNTGQLDEGMTTEIHCDDGPMTVSVMPTPTRHEPANLIGLHTLMRLGMYMQGYSFSFKNKIKWIGGMGFPAQWTKKDLEKRVELLETKTNDLYRRLGPEQDNRMPYETAARALTAEQKKRVPYETDIQALKAEHNIADNSKIYLPRCDECLPKDA